MEKNEKFFFKNGKEWNILNGKERGAQPWNYYMEWPRGVNCIKTGGGRTLCTLHRAGATGCRGYMRDSRLEIKSGRHP